MAIINKDRLRQYLDLNYNILFSGEHGVGKTTVIQQVFDEAKLKSLYFSAATLDPWVDFVGVPKVIEREIAWLGPHGSDKKIERTLELVRPAFIERDEVQAIFFDEFNRAPDKVLNAVMELIQFKSINGHKLKNLRVIWAAINPEDEEDTYAVNRLDPAHRDRFHVHIKVPFKVDDDYFRKKYPKVGNSFLDWWRELPNDIQKLVSPRRLDYAAHAYENNCRLEDFLPPETNPKKLRDLLKSLPFAEQLQNVTDADTAATFLEDVNNTTRLLELVNNNDSNAIDFFKKYAKTVPQELIEPFVELLQAKKQGITTVTSVEDFINKIPGDKGNAGTAALINQIDLGMIWRGKGGGNLTLAELLENDLRTLYAQKKNTVNKLIHRMIDVVLSCKEPNLMRFFWGVEGRAGNTPQNFYVLMEALSKINAFTASQKSQVNSKLYKFKIVENMNFI